MDAEKLIQLIPELRGKVMTVSALDGGLTNHNYRIDTGGESYVLRVAGKDTALLGIDRASEIACARAAAELGIGPEVVAYLPQHGAMLRRFVAGRVLAETDFRDRGILRRAVGALRRYHQGPAGAGHFSPFAAVRHYYAMARDRQVEFPDSLEEALDRLFRIEEETDERACPCHNDLLPGNFIDDGAELRIIDWEYAGMGDRFFDLGNLAANNEFDHAQQTDLLALYFGEVRPDHLRRLELMKLVSDMREAMWGFLQSGVSTLDVDYLAYGRKHLERFIQAGT